MLEQQNRGSGLRLQREILGASALTNPKAIEAAAQTCIPPFEFCQPFSWHWLKHRDGQIRPFLFEMPRGSDSWLWQELGTCRWAAEEMGWSYYAPANPDAHALLAARESAIRAEERQQCLSAVENEALTEPSDSEGDASYDSAIQHAAEAIRSLPIPTPGEP